MRASDVFAFFLVNHAASPLRSIESRDSREFRDVSNLESRRVRQNRKKCRRAFVRVIRAGEIIATLRDNSRQAAAKDLRDRRACTNSTYALLSHERTNERPVLGHGNFVRIYFVVLTHIGRFSPWQERRGDLVFSASADLRGARLRTPADDQTGAVHAYR